MPTLYSTHECSIFQSDVPANKPTFCATDTGELLLGIRLQWGTWWIVPIRIVRTLRDSYVGISKYGTTP